MKFLIGLFSMFCVLLCVILFLHFSQESDINTLKLVHVIFRHGDRTPTFNEVYPNDPYASTKFYPMGYGQLTNIGKRRAYNLGQVIKDRYGNFLGEIYTPELIKGITTDSDRTKMTIQLVYAALFPPKQMQVWSDDYDWMPIPYHYDKSEFDYTLRLPMSYCPKYLKELTRLEQETSESFLTAHAELLNYTSYHTGKNMNKLFDMFFLYHVLHQEDSMGLSLPQWTKSIYPDILHGLAVEKLDMQSGNLLLQRLKEGRFLSKITQNIKEKIANVGSERKMYLYSAHENQIFSLLKIFNPIHVFPKYCASIHIELHLMDNQYYIKVFYLAEPKGKFEQIPILDCNKFCPIEEFMENIQPFLPVNYTAECESRIPLN